MELEAIVQRLSQIREYLQVERSAVLRKKMRMKIQSYLASDCEYDFVLTKQNKKNMKVQSSVTLTLEAEGDPSTNIQMWK